MIVIDEPQQWPHGIGPKVGPSCHLVSTLAGAAGTAELVAFAESIGMKAKWLQKRGTYGEHFDVFGARIARAIRAGAVQVPWRDMARLWRQKKTGGDASVERPQQSLPFGKD